MCVKHLKEKKGKFGKVGGETYLWSILIYAMSSEKHCMDLFLKHFPNCMVLSVTNIINAFVCRESKSLPVCSR